MDDKKDIMDNDPMEEVKDPSKDPQKSLTEMIAALSGLANAFKRFGAVQRRKSGKTRRGAKHILGRVFKSVKIFQMTPAEYRRQHLGRLTKVSSNGKKTKFVPNYKKPHPEPRGRNLWT